MPLPVAAVAAAGLVMFRLSVSALEEFRKVILGRIAKYVDRYSPGELVEVESDHYMEVAVPARIVQELQKVIAKAEPDSQPPVLQVVRDVVGTQSAHTAVGRRCGR
jgi:hypothetical protein